jgi:hypothetical protein
MFSHHPAVRPAKKRGPGPFKQSINVAALLLLAGVVAGCTSGRSAPIAAADPSDPDAPVRAVRYSPVLDGYVSQRPVGPKPWREQNERVTPRGEGQ